MNTEANGNGIRGAPAAGSVRGAAGPVPAAAGLVLFPFRVCMASVASPVLRLELKTHLARSPLPYLASSVLVLAAGLIFAAVYGMKARFVELESGGSAAGTGVFFALTVVATAYILLAAPWISCGSFSREKREGTMDLLASTALTPSEVVGGKTISAFLRAFMPVLAMLPFFMLGSRLGGVGPLEIPKHYALFASATLFTTASGVMWSLIFRPVGLAGIVNFLVSVYAILILGVAVAIVARVAIGAYSGFSWIGMSGAFCLLAMALWALSILIYRKASKWDY